MSLGYHQPSVASEPWLQEPHSSSRGPIRVEELAEAVHLTSEDAEQALDALNRLSSKWSEACSSQATILLFRLHCALTNTVFEVQWVGHPDKPPRRALLRIYGDGTDSLFHREDEIEIFQKMSSTGQGPKLLARFPRGRVEEFLDSKALTAEQMRDPATSRRIARELRKFHGLHMRGPPEAMLWTRLTGWLAKAKEVATKKDMWEFSLDKLSDEISGLKDQLDCRTVAFCHNDLQHGNVMRHPMDGSITIIDYEYGGWNPVAFDIANHFCEWAADYNKPSSHILNFNKWPSFEERCRFIEAYLTAADDSIVSQADVESLVKEADKFALASHVLWGLWGIIMAAQGNGDFDYREYARQRFQQYFKMKAAIMTNGGEE